MWQQTKNKRSVLLHPPWSWSLIYVVDQCILNFLVFNGFSCNREQKEGVFNKFCKHLARKKIPLRERRAKQYGTEVAIYRKICWMNSLKFVALTYHVFGNYKLRSSKYWENWGAQHLAYWNPAEAARFKWHIA